MAYFQISYSNMRLNSHFIIEILDKGSKSDMRRCMYSIQSDYEKISKKPLKFNSKYFYKNSLINIL